MFYLFSELKLSKSVFLTVHLEVETELGWLYSKFLSFEKINSTGFEPQSLEPM